MVVRNLYGYLTIEEGWVANLIFILGLNNQKNGLPRDIPESLAT